MPPARPLPPYRAQLALLVPEAPEGETWLHETKYDGYRIGAALESGRARLWSRNGKDWTAQFPGVARAVERLPVRTALLDGEVAAVLPDGRTSFQALQQSFGGGARLVYFAFDLLHLDGEDLAPLPLLERKARLERLLARAAAPVREVVRFSPHVAGGGAALHREACRRGLEGIISKRANAPYRASRNGDWLKVKCLLRQELVVGGFTDPEGAARDGIGALLVGYREAPGGPLRFGGKVGTGFTNASARALRARLTRLEARVSPFDPAPRGWLGRHAHWVRPELVCEVQFTEWTDDGKARHPSFQGLREDKRAEDVVRERPTATPASGEPGHPERSSAASAAERSRRAATSTPGEPGHPERSSAASAAERSRRAATSTPTSTPTSRCRRGDDAPTAAGVRISNPGRVMFPDPDLTKLEVARYYEAVADVMLPHLRGRPLTLVHCPKGLAGGCRYMKHSKLWAPETIRRVRIREKTKTGEYLVVDDARALLSLVQMDVLELHTWNSTTGALEHPDRVVLDLDPGPDVAWPEVVRATRLVGDAVRALGLVPFVKTTGGAGLHVVVPLAPERRWEECLAFARALSLAIVRHDRARFTASFAKRGRERKILLDYLRNNRTNTSVAAFSTRARPGAPVSVPIAWDELSPRLRPDRLTVRTVPRRLRSLRADPWAGWAEAARPLGRERLHAVEALAGAEEGRAP